MSLVVPDSGKPVSSDSGISPFLLYFMATACALVVANIYYCQPLLGRFADYFDVSDNAASWVNICSQLGYGLGIFLIVPLGDRMIRRKLLTYMVGAAAVLLAGAALAPNIYVLYAFSLLVGASSTACQVFVPLAAHLATDSNRGRVIGTVMGGLLSGILLSRTLSGFVADAWGWRSIYWIAAGLMLLTSLLIYRFIPTEQPAFKGSYRSLLQSLWALLRQEKLARQSSWIGACLFGSVAVFWSTLAFFLEKPPFSYSLATIGLFGIVGMAGALISPQAGRMADQRGSLFPMRIGLILMVLGYGLLFLSTQSIFWLIGGIVLIDMGLQLAHIPNLSRMSSLAPEARTRLNTIYMTSFFIGGTIGSVVGSIAWGAYGWTGVCVTGLLFAILGAIPLLKRSASKVA
jgi:predicted MFS family arabinose efflux permease